RPFLRTEIKKAIKECETCQKIKITTKPNKGELHFLTPTKPNELLTMDLAGPFPKSKNLNKYLLVVICHFTKFCEFYPIGNIKAETIAKILVDEWFCRFGFPESVLSDQGTQFQSKLMDLIYEKRLKTTPYHPQCDGQSERTVQTVKNMIKSHIDDNQIKWDENLQKYAHAYNSSVHETPRHTPFELMFGRKPKIPIDLIYPDPYSLNREPILEKYTLINEQGEIDVLADPVDTVKKNIPQIANEYLENLKKSLKDSFETVKCNRNIRMNKAKIHHDRNIKKTEYKIGELVLTDHPELKKGLSSGIAHKYFGPFEIVGKNPNNVDYFIKKLGAKKSRTKQVHISRLKTFFHN
ncbi:unnamed protein product, partial [Brachionus calyciflorus]